MGFGVAKGFGFEEVLRKKIYETFAGQEEVIAQIVGFDPYLGFYHQPRFGLPSLALDLMEPFRPAVDILVRELRDEGVVELSPSIKRRLAGVLHADFETDEGVSTLSTVLVRLAQSLAQVYLGTRRSLKRPRSPIPLSEERAAILAVGERYAGEI